LFEDAIKLSVVQMAVFHLNIVWYCDDTNITLIALLPWKSVRYLNLANARSSHVECISLSLYSLLVDFASAILGFAQVAYEEHCEVGLPYVLFLECSVCPLFTREIK